MQPLLLSLFLFSGLLFAESNLTEKVKTTLVELLNTNVKSDVNRTEKSESNETTLPKGENSKEHFLKEQALVLEKKRLELEKRELLKKKIEADNVARKILRERIQTLIKEKDELDEKLSKDNIWASVYLNHERYQILNKKLHTLETEISVYESKSYLSKKEKLLYEKILAEYKIIEGKLSQLQEYKDDPFVTLITSPKIDEEPTLTNPFDIITAMSFQKHLKTVKEEYLKDYSSLNEAITKLYEKSVLLQELVVKTRGKASDMYVEELKATEAKLEDFQSTFEILKTSVAAFEQKVAQINLNIDDGIKKEIKKSIMTGSIILFILLLFFSIKYLVKKYMSDNELFYGTNKVINFLFIMLILIILLFAYLENIEHLVTVLSFASAGIAIALKDWFMSIIGWFVILVSGSIHVGDRMKFVKDGIEYVGDIVDISILRMTLHEDVTLTTVTHNKRSGRIIFIPNNYIFTDMIANYSHSGLKTVWDGIEFMITFDSNVAKAQGIAKEVTRKYSKGYTDMTRKQLNKLRSKYSMRNTAVEPRIFGFIEGYGVRISAWYLTNAYATLTLRSTISMEILARLQEEDDIFMAFPSQSIYMDKPAPRPLIEGEVPTEENRASISQPFN